MFTPSKSIASLFVSFYTNLPKIINSENTPFNRRILVSKLNDCSQESSV